LKFNNRIRVHLFSKPYHAKNIVAWVISTVLRNTESSLPSVMMIDWGLGTKHGARDYML